MKYRKLGNSELLISEIGFGSWLTFTDPQRKQLAISCVHRALDLGINFLDTANVYGRGAAETVLGEALTGVKRESYVLATKLFFPMSNADQRLVARADPKAAGCLTEATEGRLRGPVPMPSIRLRHTAGRDHGGADPGGDVRKGTLHRLLRMASRADRGSSGAEERCPLCLKSTAIFSVTSRTGERVAVSIGEIRDFAGGLVAACTRSSHRQVFAELAGSREQSCGGPFDGRVPKSGLVDTGDS